MGRHSRWLAQFNKKYQPEKATKIQAWWRRMLVVREAKKPLRRIFEGVVTGLTGLRCLVLIGAHDDVLGTWARAMLQIGPEAIITQALGEHSTSWLVLMRKAAFLLVLSLAYVPESPNASLYLDVLMVLLSNENAVAASGAQGSAFCQAITEYLMKQQFYRLLGQAISKLPVENSTSFQRFLTLCMLPLSTYPENSPDFNRIYVAIFAQVLSLPSLPNRLPLDRPSPLVSYLLLTTPDKLTPLIESINNKLSARSSSSLAANVFMFVSPHYKILSTRAFTSYLQLSVELFNRFNQYALCPLSLSDSDSEAEFPREPAGHDSDGSDGETKYQDSQLGDKARSPRLEVADETLSWLEKVATLQHITDLINLTQSQAVLLPYLAAYLFTVTATWPSSQQEIQKLILENSSGWLVGDLYREVVRKSPLGQEEDSMNVHNPTYARHWPPIIFLADLYSQALQTMDDNEFFGTAPGSQGCNPLTLEEVALFSVQLLNVLFSLYWRSSDYWGESNEIQPLYISSDVYCLWKALREKSMRCLWRIHAKE
ncbi:hypothetical protein GALMADRAFT_78904 [Galerina marginata CBS 339.88]|uniref:Uncharacterized protein n=1 Tax=Galerina marginata (strain CBS 339.88) TaxID=685588 RepID=A0A067SNB2_GALM3|nr:hypothetical protein GALMADRAFT_78904 [Galerina marginata CBS 339.88]